MEVPVPHDAMLPVPHDAMLPVPLEDDSVSVLNAKLSSFLYVVYIGRSVAAATGHVLSGLGREIPEYCAESQMSEGEREMYQAWKSGITLQLPVIDWDKDRGHIPSIGRPLKKALRRAEALNRIYKTDRAEPCHYIFVTEQHSVMLPLVTAVARVIGAEIVQERPSPKLSHRENELRTLLRITQISINLISQVDDCTEKQEVQVKIESLQKSTRDLQQSSWSRWIGKRKQEDTDLESQSALYPRSLVRPRLEEIIESPDGEH